VTIRPRAVRALRDARTRLRDVAAAGAAVAATARDNSHLALVRRQESLEDFLDEATDVLAAATNVYDLSQLEDITGAFKLEIADASAIHDEACVAATTAADQLRDSARQLRRAEKLVERADHDRARVEARGEQRLNDDLSGRRK